MAEAYLKEVQLPSKGKFYNGEIPDGTVSIEPMGTKEEKLFSAGPQSGTKVIEKIFDSCVVCPIDHKDLVLGDRMYLLLQIRSVSYGRTYEYPFKCDDCKKKSYGYIDLDNISVRHPKEGDADPSRFSVKLPILGNELGLRLLTGRDEDKIQRYVQQINARTRGQSNTVEYIYRLARRIDSIDGKEIGIREAMEFVEGLKGEDSLHLRDEIADHDIGPELEVEPDCQHCGFPNGPLPLPFEAEFFRPRRRRSRSDEHLRTAEAVDAP